jgi:hypothetical protein
MRSKLQYWRWCWRFYRRYKRWGSRTEVLRFRAADLLREGKLNRRQFKRAVRRAKREVFIAKEGDHGR